MKKMTKAERAKKIARIKEQLKAAVAEYRRGFEDCVHEGRVIATKEEIKKTASRMIGEYCKILSILTGKPIDYFS